MQMAPRDCQAQLLAILFTIVYEMYFCLAVLRHPNLRLYAEHLACIAPYMLTPAAVLALGPRHPQPAAAASAPVRAAKI